MKNISLFLMLIYVFASFSSYAEIYNPESIKEIKDMVGEIFEKRNPQKICKSDKNDVPLHPNSLTIKNP